MADTTPPGAEQTVPPSSGGAPLWDNAQALTSEVLELGRVLARLLLTELKLTVHALPRALAAVMALAAVGWLSWVGLTVLAGWAAYVWFANVGAGLAAFVLLNVAAAVMLVLKLRSLLNAAALPATRRQLRTLLAPGEPGTPDGLLREQAADERKTPTAIH